jgi:hypothetical protein
MTAVVRVARTVGAKKMAHPAILLICVMVATVSVLMAAHMLEVLVWALAYAIVDAGQQVPISCTSPGSITPPLAMAM